MVPHTRHTRVRAKWLSYNKPSSELGAFGPFWLHNAEGDLRITMQHHEEAIH